MLSVGDRAPSFALPDQDGKVVHLSDFAGTSVVLYFYPKDDTPGCTTQACGMRDNWALVKAAGAVVLGVSPDSPTKHVAFRKKFDLPFPLLADTDHAVADAYGAWGEKSMYGKQYFGILRTTFIIDGDGVIRHLFEKVKPAGHADQVQKALAG
ncbi:MAG: thioredoxin-dependent thiol peroxidase [Gemmatimonadota bacterium]